MGRPLAPLFAVVVVGISVKGSDKLGLVSFYYYNEYRKCYRKMVWECGLQCFCPLSYKGYKEA